TPPGTVRGLVPESDLHLLVVRLEVLLGTLRGQRGDRLGELGRSGGHCDAATATAREHRVDRPAVSGRQMGFTSVHVDRTDRSDAGRQQCRLVPDRLEADALHEWLVTPDEPIKRKGLEGFVERRVAVEVQ